MHEQNIETLRDEALRLIKTEINVLNKMMNEPGIITDAKQGETQTFDRTSTLKQIEVLTGERSKLEDLEMVVAVVGTMKSGKSTSINAIVGTEVLPNRNRPMTALPTLIRHTPGQHLPILKFDNDIPIQTLMNNLRNAINLKDNSEVVRSLIIDSDMKDLVNIIRSGNEYKTLYEGADEIFVFLRGLNDLVRISQALDIKFPFDKYDEIHELPVIEVEFAHLRETSQQKGRLTLLDTPGPNESGQPHLRKMLKEQLSKASAVLAILDFTQLKTDADEEVRKELLEIASVSGGRLYTLVNKFDQKDRHSDTADEVKSFVAESLMGGHILAKNVYPVSSRWGYLANRARYELFINNKLPNPDNHAWVADFGEEAFGRRWETKIDDVESVKAHADILWDDSLFHAPLEGVIRTAHARAAAYAVDSAAAKLVDMAERIGNLLNIRETALSKSVNDLQIQIKALQGDIKRVETSELASKKKAEATLDELTKGTEQIFDKLKSEVKKTLKVYFNEGKRIERDAYKRQELEQQKQRKEKVKSGFLGIISDIINTKTNNFSKSNIDFDPSNPVMKFDDRCEAFSLINKIKDAISDIFTQTEASMKTDMNEVVVAFQEEFQSHVISEAKNIIDEMKDRLVVSGFAIELRVPDVSTLSLGFSGSEIMETILTEKQEQVTKSRRKSGVWGTLCGWFNTDDWGWEKYETTKQYYEIDIRTIKKSTDSSVSNAFIGLSKSITEHIKKPLNDGIDDFFSVFKNTVEQIRGDLMQSIRDQEKSKSEREVLMLKLKDLKKNIPDIVMDSRGLKTDVEPLVCSSSAGGV